MRISDWSSDVCSSDLDPTIIDPLRGVPVTQGGARELDLYRQAVVGVSMEDAGRVYIDWGPGTRAWVQRAQEKPKPILEVTRIFQEEAFPGYTAFIANLSAIEALPSNWLAAPRAARGIYLLTCPRTKEQYVGSDVLPKALPVITGVRGWYGAPSAGVAQPAWQNRRASDRRSVVKGKGGSGR